MSPMTRALTRGVAAVGLFLSSYAFAVTLSADPLLEMPGGLGMSYTLDLVPDRLEHMNNKAWWSITAGCSLESVEPKIGVEVKLTKGHGSVKGHNLQLGKLELLTFERGHTFKIQADSGAEVEFKKVPLPGTTENKESARVKCAYPFSG